MIYAFEDCTVDTNRMELRRKADVVAVEPKAFDALCHLIQNADRVVSKDELLEAVWNGRIVSDASISSAIKAARAAIGDDGSRQGLIKTVHGRGFRFVGPLVSSGTAESDAAELRQDIRYCRSFDGTKIAYAISGSGPTIVKSANWLSHLEHELENPLWRHWIQAFSDGNQLIRYDERGNGLSERKPTDVSFGARVRDLETVVDTAAPDTFVLFGVSAGCSFAIDYAARHPDRVQGLILYGGFPIGWKHLDNAEETEMREAMTALIRVGWGRNNPAFRQLFTSAFMPDATAEEAGWFNELQKRAAQPEIAARLHDAAGTINVIEALGQIKAPTLVIHARDDGIIPLVAGQMLASDIPGARFVTVESKNHILMRDEGAFDRMMEEVRRFLAEVR